MVAAALLAVLAGVTIVALGSRSDEPPPTTAPTTTTTAPSVVWQNPVIPTDFPDPSVVRDGSRYIAVATNGPGGRVQVSTSPDLATWTRPAEALAAVPAWATSRTDRVWAPAVAKFGDVWVMYVTMQDASSGRQCIATATSLHATGPYAPTSSGPIVCPAVEGGAIDPEVLTTGTGSWLLWKVDGNCCGRPSTIRSQPLATDGLSLTGRPATLIGVDQSWERGPTSSQSTVEGPSMVEVDGRFVLLYSASGYAGAGYAMGSAVCTTPAGPCVKPSTSPLVSSGTFGAGPGGGSFFTDERSRRWIAYHAWDPARVGYAAGGVRSMRIDPVTIVDGRVVVLGPTSSQMHLGPADQVPTSG